MSWIAMTAPVCINSRQASSRSFSVNGSPTCTAGRFASASASKDGRGHGRAMDAVAAGLRAEIDDFIADPARLGVENLIGLGDAHRHGVDENIAVIARVEIRRAADGRHPKTIAIGADPGDDPRDKMARARMIRRAETQQVEAGDRPRAHGEHIAQDAANAGRGPLKRLDVGGVVVALHLEDAGVPIADVDDTGVFARPLNDPGRLGRQFAQMFARGFVGAMLVPHGRENAELGKGRRPADEGEDALIFVRLQAMRGDEIGGDCGSIFAGKGPPDRAAAQSV